RPSAVALTPLLLFLALFFDAGLWFTLQGEPMGFYQLRAPVAILPALALGAWIAHRRKVPAMDTLLSGMGDSNVMLMCLIFLLAGAFAMVSKAIGAVDAVVALGRGAPRAMLPARALGAWIAHRRKVRAMDRLLSGMGDSNVMLMCLICLLAGAFAMVSKAIGAVDAVVALGLGTLPPALILPGLF